MGLFFVRQKTALFPVKQKMILTPADCPFGTGDGVYESACRDAAKPLSCCRGTRKGSENHCEPYENGFSIDKRSRNVYNFFIERKGEFAPMLKEKLKQTNSLEVFSGVGILLFLVGVPFFLSERYYYMTLAKTLFFFGASAFFAVGCLILRYVLKKEPRRYDWVEWPAGADEATGRKIPIVKKSVAKAVLLSFLTLGGYFIYWEYLLVRNAKAVKGDGTGCVKELLCLVFVPFYLPYWLFSRGRSVGREFEKHGYPAKGGEVGLLLLGLSGLGLVAAAILQKRFNSLPSDNIPDAAYADRQKSVRPPIRIPLVRKNSTELFFLLFIGLAVVSCVFAMDPFSSFTGGKGRNMGLMTFLFIFLAYVFVSRFGQFRTPVAMIFGGSLVVIVFIGFLQFCRLDPFGLYAETKGAVRKMFMTLLGNKDVYYSYLALAVPFSMYLVFEAKSLREQIFWYAVSWAGFIGVLTCNCEGGYICLAVSFLFFALAKCRDKKGLLVLLRIVMLLFIACVLISCLRFNFRRGNISEETLTRIFLSPVFYGVGLPAAAALYLLAMKKELPPKFFAVFRKTVVIAVAVTVLGVIAAFVYFSFINTTADIGKFETFLRVGSKRWGNGRGVIWQRMWTLYTGFPFFRKLIGAGEESVYYLLTRFLPGAFVGATQILDNAHNEYLQYLVTHGLLGLTAYVLFAVSAVRRGFKKGGRYQRAAAFGACCFLVQAFFNLLQAITTPMLFVFLALAQTVDITVPKKVPVAAGGTTDGAPEGEAPEETKEPVPAAAEDAGSDGPTELSHEKKTEDTLPEETGTSL